MKSDLENNPRPNHRLIRSCGSCKHFVSWNGHDYKGKCILPDGIHMNKKKDYVTKENWKKFANTYISCICDNHEWKTPGRVKQILDYVEVPFDENS